MRKLTNRNTSPSITSYHSLTPKELPGLFFKGTPPFCLHSDTSFFMFSGPQVSLHTRNKIGPGNLEFRSRKSRGQPYIKELRLRARNIGSKLNRWLSVEVS
ncbi:hypothetical protein TNCT_419111 [Trichonephila clavata]|uniref:Uncharacterized protein n=1 Tax=Trichonephila clavata TaxID=2740835 RepID=A0A8X6HV10_TRICU|nr:hypothetical protein TNCT_419111 [Trichonephila clavata]